MPCCTCCCALRHTSAYDGSFAHDAAPQQDEYDEYEDDFVVDEEEEEEDWRQEIRKLTGYDPRR